MSNVATHAHDGEPFRVTDMVTCGACFASWCERCDPAPSALCHYCAGRGYSLAPVPPRQRRAMGIHYPGRRRVS